MTSTALIGWPVLISDQRWWLWLGGLEPDYTLLWCRLIKDGRHVVKTDGVVTRELAGHPAQGECRRGAAEGPDRWGCWPPTPPQRVLDGEVVCILLQRVIQRVHQAILPQLVKHQRGEDLREARDSAITVIKHMLWLIEWMYPGLVIHRIPTAAAHINLVSGSVSQVSQVLYVVYLIQWRPNPNPYP